MKKGFITTKIFITGLFVMVCCGMGWTENIALLIPQALILEGDDPVNDPIAKEFTIETLEIEQIGLFWLVNHLENDLGHTVNIYGSDNDDPGVVEEENDLIFISEAIGSGSVAGDYRVSIKPVIFTESYLLDDMGFSNGESAWTGGAMTTEVKIVNQNHPITQGLPETFTISQTNPDTGEPYAVTFGAPTDLSIMLDIGEVLSVLPSSVNESADGAEMPEDTPWLIAVEEGTELDAGDTNLARWVFLGYSDVIPNEEYGGDPETRTLSVLSDLGVQLLDQAIAWALGETVNVMDWALY